MEEGQPSDVRPRNAGKRTLFVIATIAVVAIAVVAVVLSGVLSTAKKHDNDKLITKANEELVIGLGDLPSGWEVTTPYQVDPYEFVPNASEVGVARYTRNISSAPLSFEVVTLEIYRINTTVAAVELFAQYRAAQGVHSWPHMSIDAVVNVSVGDEAILSSGNWTASHGAIKILAFRENNAIVFLTYEATENFGLTNEAAIEVAKKQDAKLLS